MLMYFKKSKFKISYFLIVSKNLLLNHKKSLISVIINDNVNRSNAMADTFFNDQHMNRSKKASGVDIPASSFKLGFNRPN